MQLAFKQTVWMFLCLLVCAGPCAEQQTLQCVTCDEVRLVKDLQEKESFFLLYPLSRQLKNLFEKSDLQKFIVKPSDDSDNIRYTTDGSAYKRTNIAFPQAISLTWNTDGVPLFSSNNCSLWPVYLTINELLLNVKQRFIMLVALWKGSSTSKPRIETIFKPLLMH